MLCRCISRNCLALNGQAWKPKYAIVSGSRLAWFDSETAPPPASKPAGAMGLQSGVVTVTAAPPAPKEGAPKSSTISVSAADGGSTVQLGFMSPDDARTWELALRAATGDAAARASFFASRAPAASAMDSPGDGSTAPTSTAVSTAAAHVAPDSAERSSVNSEALTVYRDVAEEAELSRPSADAASTAALQSRIAELEAQHAAEAARRVDAERAAAAEAARVASLHAEREAARQREARLEAELQRRSEAVTEASAKALVVGSVMAAQEQAPAVAIFPPISDGGRIQALHTTMHDTATYIARPSELLGQAHAAQPQPADASTAAAEASMIAAALPLPSAVVPPGPTESVHAVVPGATRPEPPPPLPPPPSEAAAAALLVSAAAPPVSASSSAPLKAVGSGSGGDDAVLRPAMVADWGPWACDPDGEERVAMKKRM